mmetsp:Transcript_2052/g.6642  ORF Transcript_2052/g.6642 Transcript_2052/m.6642 type:complete len:225 (-) Transcript_2052:1262-1936(-)
MSSVFIPLVCASSAHPTPVAPPPMTRTSKFCAWASFHPSARLSSRAFSSGERRPTRVSARGLSWSSSSFRYASAAGSPNAASGTILPMIEFISLAAVLFCYGPSTPSTPVRIRMSTPLRPILLSLLSLLSILGRVENTATVTSLSLAQLHPSAASIPSSNATHASSSDPTSRISCKSLRIMASIARFLGQHCCTYTNKHRMAPSRTSACNALAQSTSIGTSTGR